MRILIVDDNALNLKLLRAVLEEYLHEVVEAHDGEEALKVLDSIPVGAIISDILMPRMDGYRLCYEVRSSERFAEVPFVVYTSTYNSPADEKLCLDLGADRYVRKPATSLELLCALGEAIAAPHRPPVVSPDGKNILKEYSERLIEKLEEKNLELEAKSDELAESEFQLRSLLAYSPSIIYSLDWDGQVVKPNFISENMLRILGVTMEEADYDWWLRSLHPDDRDRARDTLIRALGTDGGTHEYRIRHKDGEFRWMQDTNRVIRDEAGKPVKVVGAWVDITSRKLAEEELQKTLDSLEKRVRDRTATLAKTNEQLQAAKAAADAANKSKSEFLSRMSHELRTPMNSILGFGQLLEFSKLDDGQKDSLSHILKAGKHLLRLINEVLEISRIEAGSVAVSLEVVDLSEVLEECTALTEPMARDRHIKLSWSSPEKAAVKADRQRLCQVMLNLLSNAIKYNVENGKVRVRVQKESGKVTCIEVSDTGVGIPEEMHPKLFLPFERLAAASSPIEGTGLGLSLSKALIEAMGGELTLSASSQDGCCFRILLGSAEEEEASQTPIQSISLDTSVGNNLKGKVLAIEDNLINSQLLARIFAPYPEIELICAMQGRLGLQLATDNDPDLILLDLHLPDMSGNDVLSEIRANKVLAHIPVIVVTADAFSDQSEVMVRAGAFRYLTKPFVLSELIAAVAAGLSKEKCS